jgi:hypothetical protein
MEQLDGAKKVVYDPDYELTMAWFGGHGIHAYNSEGTEVAFWNIGDWSQNSATLEEVEEDMEEMLINQNYYEFV